MIILLLTNFLVKDSHSTLSIWEAAHWTFFLWRQVFIADWTCFGLRKMLEFEFFHCFDPSKILSIFEDLLQSPVRFHIFFRCRAFQRSQWKFAVVAPVKIGLRFQQCPLRHLLRGLFSWWHFPNCFCLCLLC